MPCVALALPISPAPLEGLVDSYFALAAFVLGICLAVAVVFIIVQRLEIERLEGLIRPWDHDGDGAPGGRKRHDPYIDR